MSHKISLSLSASSSFLETLRCTN